MDELAAITGPNIRQARIDAGISQQQLADLLGIDRRRISVWERKEHAPEHKRIIQLAAVLGKPWPWFYQPHMVREIAS